MNAYIKKSTNPRLPRWLVICRNSIGYLQINYVTDNYRYARMRLIHLKHYQNALRMPNPNWQYGGTEWNRYFGTSS